MWSHLRYSCLPNSQAGINKQAGTKKLRFHLLNLIIHNFEHFTIYPWMCCTIQWQIVHPVWLLGPVWLLFLAKFPPCMFIWTRAFIWIPRVLFLQLFVLSCTIKKKIWVLHRLLSPKHPWLQVLNEAPDQLSDNLMIPF